jgi:ABC-type polysaccharide/polyol phosphate export permease
MGDYLRRVWHCRYFWLSLVRIDLRSRYRGSVLGLGWSLLNPVAMTIIFCLVFLRLFPGEDLRTYAPYVLTGLSFWNYIVTTTLMGCQCFFQGEVYIRQYPAPTAIYPLRIALGNSVHLLIAMSIVLLITGMNIGLRLPAVLSLIPTLLLLVLFGWSLATLAGYATVSFRDTRHLTEIGFQALFYLTPIMYRYKVLVQNHLTWVLHCNPLIPLLRLVSEPLQTGLVPEPVVYAKAVLVTAAATGLAVYVLARREKRLIFHL